MASSPSSESVGDSDDDDGFGHRRRGGIQVIRAQPIVHRRAMEPPSRNQIIDYSFMRMTKPQDMLTAPARSGKASTLVYAGGSAGAEALDGAADRSNPGTPSHRKPGDGTSSKGTKKNKPPPAAAVAGGGGTASALAALKALSTTSTAPSPGGKGVTVINSGETTYAFDESRNLVITDDQLDQFLNGVGDCDQSSNHLGGATKDEAAAATATAVALPLYSSDDVAQRRACSKYDGSVLRLCHNEFSTSLDIVTLADAIDAVVAPVPTTGATPVPFSPSLLTRSAFTSSTQKRNQVLHSLDLSECGIQRFTVLESLASLSTTRAGDSRAATTPGTAMTHQGSYDLVVRVVHGLTDSSALLTASSGMTGASLLAARGGNRPNAGAAASHQQLALMAEAQVRRAARALHVLKHVKVLYLHGNELRSLDEVGKWSSLLRYTLTGLTVHGNNQLDVRTPEAKATLLRWFPRLEMLNLAKLTKEELSLPVMAKAQAEGLAQAAAEELRMRKRRPSGAA